MWWLGPYLAYALALSLLLARRGVRAGEPDVRASGVPSSPRRILVIGATGGTGRALVEEALARGLRVTAFVRDPSRLRIEHPNLSLARGDVLDPVSVNAAVAGQEAVLSALGHRRFYRPTRILSDGTRNILRAMERHGVRRFVCETSLGIGGSAFRMGLTYTLFVIPLILPFYFWDKTRQERSIEASDLDWVIVRPGALTNAAPRGRYRHGARVGSLLRTVRVSRRDVASFMLDQLASDRYLRRAPGVAW